MELFTLSSFSRFLWSFGFLPGMLCCGLVLTYCCKGLQFRRFFRALRHTVFSSRAKPSDTGSAMTPLQAASTALASTVGTGNIVGTAQAICMGGPGALFWLWVTALLAMIIKYAEIALSSLFRSPDGRPAGPMPYIEVGLHSRFAARCYAFFALFSGLGMGNLAQVNSIVSCALSLSSPYLAPQHELAARLLLGLFLAVLVLLAMSGGAERIGRVSALLFPLMAALFLLTALLVIAVNASRLPTVLGLILRSAFHPRPVLGAASGFAVRECILWGVRRSAFSNEAGLGCSALAHSASAPGNPAEHGLWGVFEVFADTIVICTATGLVILCSGVTVPWGSAVGPELYECALASVFGARAASLLLGGIIGLFAFSSVLGWSLYGRICADYLFGRPARLLYSLVFLAFTIIGCVMSTDQVWAFADLFNALMSLPNLAALVSLADTVGNLSLDEY